MALIDIDGTALYFAHTVTAFAAEVARRATVPSS